MEYTSDIFQKCMKDNGILQLRSAPVKPCTNGIAEICIGTFKSSMRDLKLTSNDFNLKVNSFLIRYRNTPHTITGETKSKLFQGRNLRIRLVKTETYTHTKTRYKANYYKFTNEISFK